MRSAPIAAVALVCAACASPGARDTRAPGEPDPSRPNVTPPPPRAPTPSAEILRWPEIESEIDDSSLPSRPEYPCPPYPFAPGEMVRSRDGGSLRSGVSDAGAIGNLGLQSPEGGVHGRLDPAAIRNVVISHSAPIRECYDEGLRKNPGIGGGVTIDFMIEKDGRASSVVPVCTNVADSAVVACVAAEFERMRFPPSSAVSSVRWPLRFRPK